MKSFIILDKEYNENSPSYVTSIAVSTSYFNERCIHSNERIYNFYKEDKDYEIVFVENAFEHNHFKSLIEKLKKQKDDYEIKYAETIKTLNRINDTLDGTSQ